MSINAFEHIPSTGFIQFPHPPLRGNDDQLSRRQVGGYDSDGNWYAYHRNSALDYDHQLVYAQVPLAQLDKLIVFVQSRNGDKVPFTWYDHNGTAHTVRFIAGRLSWKETSPGRYRVEVNVRQEF